MAAILQSLTFGTNNKATLGPCPLGSVWTVLVSVPQATNSSSFEVYLQGTQLGSMQGTATFGPFQMRGNEVLTIVSTGAAVTAAQTVTVMGQADSERNAPTGIFPVVSGGVVTTTGGGYPLDPPQSGSLASDIDSAATGTVVFPITLSAGTWLVTFNGTVLSTAAGCSPGFYIVAGSATASFSGASACQGYAASSGEEKNLSFTSLVTVTTGGTLNITFYNNNTNINILATVAAGTETPGATGWTATRVA